MTQLDPAVQTMLIEATLELLGSNTRLRSEDHARKYIASFRFVYFGLANAVLKGETRAEGEEVECFQRLPQLRSGK